MTDDHFDAQFKRHGLAPLRARRIETLQVNLGKICNQVCRHCHVDAGPMRTESMSAENVDACLEILLRYPEIKALDITGGAPEIHPHFRRFAREARRLKRRVIDRCNLTIFFVDGHRELPEFLAENQIEVIASLPCYTAENVDKQRGKGVFEQSIDALKKLNTLGYGRDYSGLTLNLVYNPLGPSLPPPQEKLEADYKRQLFENFGIVFNQLFTITNMPIRRFKSDLEARGQFAGYMQKLEASFNPIAASDVMCRDLISISWDGRLFDCDFNQMLELPLRSGQLWTLRDFDAKILSYRSINTGSHCFGCTAGSGSSCGGALSATVEKA